MEKNNTVFKKQVEVYSLSTDGSKLETLGYFKVKKKDFKRTNEPAPSEEGKEASAVETFVPAANFFRKSRKWLGVQFDATHHAWTFVNKDYLRNEKARLATRFRTISKVV